MPYITFVTETPMDFDTFDTSLWDEIRETPGEIFDLDIPELRDDKFDVNDYLNANYDY